jgi:hypothetical protein
LPNHGFSGFEPLVIDVDIRPAGSEAWNETVPNPINLGACRPLAVTFYNLGDFETARQYAIRGVQIWRSGSVQSHAEDFGTPVVGCLCYQALCELHFGEIASSDATLTEAILLAKELNDMSALGFALWHAGCLAHLKLRVIRVKWNAFYRI